MLGQGEIIQTLQERDEKQKSRKAQVGLISGIIDDAKKFFTKNAEYLAHLVTSKTLSVEVKNQLKLPDTQKVDGSVSIKEIKALVAGLEAVRGEVQKLEKLSTAISKLSTDLKPVPVDFSTVEKAIKAIHIPETVIPEAPETVSISNLAEVTKAMEGFVKAIPQPEAVVIPEYPTSIEVNNLAPLAKELKALTKTVDALASRPEPVQDYSELAKGLASVKDAVDSIQFPIPQFKSSWNQSLDMQSQDAATTFTYTTVAATKVISYVQFVANDGNTYRKTFSYTSSDPANPDATTGWVRQ